MPKGIALTEAGHGSLKHGMEQRRYLRIAGQHPRPIIVRAAMRHRAATRIAALGADIAHYAVDSVAIHHHQCSERRRVLQPEAGGGKPGNPCL